MAARALLPPLVADAIRHALDVALPTALPVPWHGATLDERAALLHRGWEDATAGASRDIDPFVRDAFHLLARPEVSVELVVGDVMAKRDESAIVVTDGGFALLARYDQHRGLLLEAVRPTGLPSALVGLLPAHPPGRGNSAAAPTALLRQVSDRVGRSAAALERELARNGVRHQDAEVIADVLTAPRLRTGQLCATGFAPHGGKGHLVELQVGFVDTGTGRYLTQENGDHVTIAPANDARLVERTGELVRLAYELR